MTVKELWSVAPQSFVFIAEVDGQPTATMTEYCGGKKYADSRVIDVRATAYPMHKSVLEIKIET